MATKSNLMGLGLPAPLANRMGDCLEAGTSVTAQGATQASAYQIGGTQYVVNVTASSSGCCVSLPTIGGGCTVGLRAMMIALTFGYGNFHLFGFDTCLPDEETHHAYEFATDREDVGKVTRIRLGSTEGKEFLMADYHIAQLFDFKTMLKAQARRMRITVHGGGALAEIMRFGCEQAQLATA